MVIPVGPVAARPKDAVAGAALPASDSLRARTG